MIKNVIKNIQVQFLGIPIIGVPVHEIGNEHHHGVVFMVVLKI
jgi:hypothetical protein